MSGASLVSAIATSSGAAAAYVREGYSSIRIGMVVEIALPSAVRWLRRRLTLVRRSLILVAGLLGVAVAEASLAAFVAGAVKGWTPARR